MFCRWYSFIRLLYKLVLLYKVQNLPFGLPNADWSRIYVIGLLLISNLLPHPHSHCHSVTCKTINYNVKTRTLLLQSCQIAEVKTKMVQQTQVWLNI